MANASMFDVAWKWESRQGEYDVKFGRYVLASKDLVIPKNMKSCALSTWQHTAYGEN